MRTQRKEKRSYEVEPIGELIGLNKNGKLQEMAIM